MATLRMSRFVVSSITLLICSLVLLFIDCTLAVPAFAKDTPVEEHGQLRVVKGRVVDQHGRPVMLRGMSLFWSQKSGQYYNSEAIRWLRDDWNINIVRCAMAVRHGGYLRNPVREQKKVEAVVQAALDLGIYVILDWHTHHPESEAAQEFFAKMAKKFGDHPNLIYELWNEPLDEHSWSKVIKPYHEAVIRRIRQHDPDNLIVCGTRSWSQDVDEAAADPLDFENVAYTLHFYAASHQQSLRDKAKLALDRGIALMATEWGTCEYTGNGKLDVEQTRLWFEFMDKQGISWCNWSITDRDETSAALPPGAAAHGNWPVNKLSPSGRLVREELRAKNRSPEK